jgi:hypothetical protein
VNRIYPKAVGHHPESRVIAYQKERDRQIVELWLGGMSMKAIGVAVGLKHGISAIIRRYCDRERRYSADGRSWAYQLARTVHPDAPLTEALQAELWPMPPKEDDDAAGDFVADVLEAADALNDALDRVERLHPYWFDGPDRRVAMRVHGGRIYVSIDCEGADDAAD